MLERHQTQDIPKELTVIFLLRISFGLLSSSDFFSEKTKKRLRIESDFLASFQ